jgi:hypothetical protein
MISKPLLRKLHEKLSCLMGATSVEYAIIAVLIAAVIVAVVVMLGGQVLELFEKVPPF